MLVTDIVKFFMVCLFLAVLSSGMSNGCERYNSKLELEEPATQVVFYEKEFYG